MVVHFKVVKPRLRSLRQRCRDQLIIWRESLTKPYSRGLSLAMEANFAFEYLLKEGHFCEEDQTVYEDFIDELIRKYLFDENMSR